MATLVSYKGLEVLDTPVTGAGGEAINDDLIELADRAPTNSTSDPLTTDDSSKDYFAGSLWLNTTDQTLFMCTDPTLNAAVWKSILKRNTSSLSLVPDSDGTVDVDNLSFSGNTLSSTNTNGDILLSPNGDGNVGIGTGSPDRLLSLASDGPRIRLTDDTEGAPASATAVIEFFYEDSGGTQQLMSYIGFTSSGDANFEIRNALNGNIEFWTNAAQHMVLDSSGQLAIGTNPSADALLDVDGAIAVHDVSASTPSGTSGKAKIYLDGDDLKVVFGTGSPVIIASKP